MPSAQKILVPSISHCPQPSGCQTLPKHQLRAPDAEAPPQATPTGASLCWRCSQSPSALRRGLRSWGNGLVGLRQVLGALSLGTTGYAHSPYPAEVIVATFLCWAFSIVPRSFGSLLCLSTKTLRRGRQCENGDPCVRVCMRLICMCQDSRCSAPPARLTFCSPPPNKDTGWAATSTSLRKGAEGPHHHPPLRVSSACGSLMPLSWS